MPRLILAAFLLGILFSLPIAAAIEFPKSVNYLKIRLVQSGEIEIARYPESSLKKASIFIYIPQEDQRQKVQLQKISPPSYQLVKDEYGNSQIRLDFFEPKENALSYRIESLIEITTAHPGGNISFTGEMPLTRPTPEILKSALEIGGSSLEKLAKLTIWVNSFVSYDRALEAEVKPAEWVFKNRRGTCDEFSMLLISLTRAFGIPYRYAAGLAYSERFERHGWVELFVNNSWIPFDPTWALANYLDATHIKLANLPDANFTEKVEIEGRNVEISWKKPTSYEIEILESREIPPLKVDVNLLTEKIGLGRFLLEAELEPKGCLIATLTLTSCKVNGEDLFDISDRKRSTWLCEKSMRYWTGEVTAELRKGYIYSCTLVLASEFGQFKNATIAIDPAKKMEEIEIFPKLLTATPAMPFNISAKTTLSDFYLLYQDRIEPAKRGILTLQSPQMAGSYEVWAIGLDGSSGHLALEVVEEKAVKILEIKIPANLTQEVYYLINVSLQNLGNKSLKGQASVAFDGKVLAANVTFGPKETLVKAFNVSFESAGRQEIRVILEADGHRDVQFAEVEVLGKEIEALPLIEGFLRRLIELIQNLISTARALVAKILYF